MDKFNVGVIDIEPYLYKACTACKELYSDDGFIFVERYDIRHGIDYLEEEVNKLRERFGINTFYMVLGDRESNFRKILNPAYKIGRKPKPVMYEYMEQYIRAVYTDNVVMLPYLEADDTCRIVYEDVSKETYALLISIDKDFKTIPSNLYRCDDGDVEVITAHDALRNLCTQVITGDVTDGYFGIKGIGAVKAKVLLSKNVSLSKVLELYEANGLTLGDFNTNYNMAKLLTKEEYDFTEMKPKILSDNMWQSRKPIEGKVTTNGH